MMYTSYEHNIFIVFLYIQNFLKIRKNKFKKITIIEIKNIHNIEYYKQKKFEIGNIFRVLSLMKNLSKSKKKKNDNLNKYVSIKQTLNFCQLFLKSNLI